MGKWKVKTTLPKGLTPLGKSEINLEGKKEKWNQKKRNPNGLFGKASREIWENKANPPP